MIMHNTESLTSAPFLFRWYILSCCTVKTTRRAQSAQSVSRSTALWRCKHGKISVRKDFRGRQSEDRGNFAVFSFTVQLQE